MLAVAEFTLLVVLAAVVPDRSGSVEMNSWVGKTVMVITTGIEIGQLDERLQIVPPLAPLLGLDYRVYGERGDFVQLKTREAVVGWTAKKNVVVVEDAVAYFSKHLDRNPEDLTALNHRGWALSLRGDHLAGVKDMTEAIRISPETSFYNNRARIWGRMGEHEKALADYNIAIEMGPQFYLPISNRGTCWHAMKEYDKAIADFDRSLKLNPQFAAGYRNRGLSWHAKGDYDRAIADLTESLRIDGRSAAALADRGNAWLAKGDLAKARHDIDDAIHFDGEHGPAFCYRARLAVAQKQEKNALADFAFAIRLDSTFAPTYQNRARIWQQQKEYAKARADLDHALRLEPKNADTLAALAFHWAACPDAKMRDGKRALVLAHQAVHLEKTNAEAQQALAAAWAEAGDFEAAIRTQQAVLDGGRVQDTDTARRRLELYRKKQAYRLD